MNTEYLYYLLQKEMARHRFKVKGLFTIEEFHKFIQGCQRT